ncbi:MAG: hypothetical protein AMJ60_10010 [Desulfobacterales bacterium SG8_35]|nr:MAG: hypothetical protein AMJ60_10010 [Desulfobacterales bacterium SG8_35]
MASRLINRSGNNNTERLYRLPVSLSRQFMTAGRTAGKYCPHSDADSLSGIIFRDLCLYFQAITWGCHCRCSLHNSIIDV